MNTHRSQDSLKSEIDRAKQSVAIGSQYTHYKDQTKRYTVLDIAVLEWNDEPCVIYRADYQEHLTFVRPVENWLDTVIVDGIEVSRFSKHDKID